MYGGPRPFQTTMFYLIHAQFGKSFILPMNLHEFHISRLRKKNFYVLLIFKCNQLKMNLIQICFIVSNASRFDKLFCFNYYHSIFIAKYETAHITWQSILTRKASTFWHFRIVWVIDSCGVSGDLLRIDQQMIALVSHLTHTVSLFFFPVFFIAQCKASSSFSL